jgi:hypothetical protein
MKGLIKQVGSALGALGAAAGLSGCYHYANVVDPCYPARYEYMARREVKAAFAPQVNNGHVLDQTIWNYHFEAGTDRLTAGGLEHLAYLARRRPHPDTLLFMQTAQDIPYDPVAPDKLAEARQELDCKRIQAIQKFLTAQTAAQCAFKVEVHDPAEVGLAAIPVNAAVQQMFTTRFRGGLTGGGGGSATAGGSGALPAGQ